MRTIGIAYDRPEDYPHATGPSDRFAEFEPESTIIAMEEAIRYAGFQPKRLGGPHAILAQKPDVDLIWNIAEGYGSRNREAWVPVLCEMYNIPYLGSDAYTLTVSLNKTETRKKAQELGIPVAKGQLITDSKECEQWKLAFPVFCKPNFEGTSKGIGKNSLARTHAELRAIATYILDCYQQPVLAEEFLSGAEYTCAVYGAPLRCGPVLERGICSETGIGIHALEKDGFEADYELKNQLTEEREAEIKKWSLNLCKAMDVRHFARLDFKCDALGNPHFLEINPLPTFSTDSTFAIMAELEGKPYPRYLGELLQEIISG